MSPNEPRILLWYLSYVVIRWPSAQEEVKSEDYNILFFVMY